jgi:hypothetical protein
VPAGGIKSFLSKSGLKISSMLKNLNADAVLRLFPPANSTRMAAGRFRAISRMSSLAAEKLLPIHRLVRYEKACEERTSSRVRYSVTCRRKHRCGRIIRCG